MFSDFHPIRPHYSSQTDLIEFETKEQKNCKDIEIIIASFALVLPVMICLTIIY
jgi:hypothetical protein